MRIKELVPRRSPLFVRFMSKVKKTKTCWLWLGKPFKSGYGRLTVEGRSVRASRIAYKLFKGPIPSGMKVLHDCDNPLCVRPDHLHTGTDADNARERGERGRTAHGDHVSYEKRARGENQGSARLTAKDVLEIRHLSAKRIGHRRIASRYEVAPTTIRKILSGATWSHV